MLQVLAQHDVIPGSPGQARRDRRDAVGDIASERDLIRLGADQPREQPAGFLDPAEHRLLVERARDIVVEISIERRPRAGGQQRPRRNVQIRACRRAGELRANLIEPTGHQRATFGGRSIRNDNSFSRAGEISAGAPISRSSPLLVQREQDDLADIRLIGQHHHDPVDARRRRRHAAARHSGTRSACRRSALPLPRAYSRRWRTPSA